MPFLIYSCKMYQVIQCIYMHWNLQIKNHTKLNTFILMYLCFNHILRIHTDIVSTITSKCKMNCLFEHKQCSPVFCLFEYNDGVFIVWGVFKSGANFVDFRQNQKKSWKTRMTTAIKMTMQMMATINGVIFRQKAMMLIDWASSTWKSN